jgi:hypothetical protein
MGDGAPKTTPIGGSLQDLVTVQGNGVRYLGQLIGALKTSFPGQFAPVPANATATGTPNQVAYDASFFYICVATNTWKRVAISSF